VVEETPGVKEETICRTPVAYPPPPPPAAAQTGLAAAPWLVRTCPAVPALPPRSKRLAMFKPVVAFAEKMVVPSTAVVATVPEPGFAMETSYPFAMMKDHSTPRAQMKARVKFEKVKLFLSQLLTLATRRDYCPFILVGLAGIRAGAIGARRKGLGNVGTMNELESWLDSHAAPLVAGTRQQGIWFVSVSNRVTKATGSGVTLESALRMAMEGWCYQCAAGTCDK